MNDLSPRELTRLALEAREGKTDGNAVLAECLLFVYRKLQCNPFLDEDVRQDFFIAILPYLKKFLERFVFRGIPLERCLTMIVKKRLNSFFRSQRRDRFLWFISQDASFAPVYAAEDPAPSPLYARLAELLGAGPDGRLPTPTARKWFLVWMLKHCRHLSADDLALTARVAGCDEAWLRERAEGLCALRSPQTRRLEKLRQRRNRLFVRARVLELRIIRELDADAKKTLVKELETKRRALRNAVRSISRIAWDPSHLMIAKALGLPKGTVDTIVARIRRLLEARVEEKASFTA
jgi:DNA-directed RNA polymerase specialized sigma24 family protein